MKKLMSTEAKQIDLVDFLHSIGYQPQKIRNQDYWYLSPFREEKTPSFKINRSKNVWYDHGIGKGGNLVDFGTLYFNCSVADLLHRLSEFQNAPSLSFHQQNSPGNFSQLANVSAGEKKELFNDSKIIVLETRPLAEKSLLDYLQKRSIPLPIANKFCREVDFLLYSKKQTVIGFKNNEGGYELRNKFCKNCSRPKAITTIKNKSKKIAVFEGFFDFLSFLVLIKNQSVNEWDFCVLNSVAFMEKSWPFLLMYESVHLFLDNDLAGQNCTRFAMKLDKKIVDKSDLYRDYKDLNECIMMVKNANNFHQEKDLSMVFKQTIIDKQR